MNGGLSDGGWLVEAGGVQCCRARRDGQTARKHVGISKSETNQI
ncbi:unnamed protein product [Nippostrongylus brasiliensis]|uniref:Uncharacterized protein n=1 Tax=Nippostrongylus brasiliensis TaxID=27835 RepID=A0A0N4XSL2_NIPBR|nr:unnamed protein product [Nippostrongylus brasiliensis]